MNFLLEDFLKDKKQIQEASDNISRKAITQIKREKSVTEMSDRALFRVKKQLSWVLGYRTFNPLAFSREQNLYNDIEAEIIKRSNT